MTGCFWYKEREYFAIIKTGIEIVLISMPVKFIDLQGIWEPGRSEW